LNLNSNLSSLASLPGVTQCAIADDSGRLLDCAGEIAPPSTAILVLAHATLAAATELGRHTGSGDCREITQQHDNGVFYLHTLPQGRVLLVRCQHAGIIPAVRGACQQWLSPVGTTAPTPVVTTLDLASALHAEPNW
jgi:hypothetical protein